MGAARAAPRMALRTWRPAQVRMLLAATREAAATTHIPLAAPHLYEGREEFLLQAQLPLSTREVDVLGGGQAEGG